jgi:RNA polymerase sigma-70 factor (sigma-E family)
MQRRSEDDFDLFVSARSAPLFRTALLMCAGDRAAAADAVQTTMVEIWRRWPRVRAMERADSYAKKVLVTSILRDRRRNSPLLVVVSEPPDYAADAAGATDLPTRHDLWSIVRELPRMQRAVVVLRYYEDLTEAQTADALGIGIGTVKSHCSRALETMRRTLPQEYLTGGGQ